MCVQRRMRSVTWQVSRGQLFWNLAFVYWLYNFYGAPIATTWGHLKVIPIDNSFYRAAWNADAV